MFKTRVLAQRIFLCIFFVISNVENHEKIAFMKIKKKCRAGAKCRARWDQNHLIFFTWPKSGAISTQILCSQILLRYRTVLRRQWGLVSKNMLILFERFHCCGVNALYRMQNFTPFRSYRRFNVLAL